jgi:hypothetical protein
MIKSYLEFKQAEEAIKLAEDVLMRPLTDDEKEMIIVRGFMALMESLEVSQEDWKMLHEVRQVLAAYTSGDEELFINTLPQCPLAKELFEFILAAYDAADDIQEELAQEEATEGDELCTDPYSCEAHQDKSSRTCDDPILKAVQRMLEGETVKLDNQTREAVCNHLSENFMNYFFKSVNGESSLKVNK